VDSLLQSGYFKNMAGAQEKEDQDRHLAAAQTLVYAGNFAGATQVLNPVDGHAIFERSDPRVTNQLRRN